MKRLGWMASLVALLWVGTAQAAEEEGGASGQIDFGTTNFYTLCVKKSELPADYKPLMKSLIGYIGIASGANTNDCAKLHEGLYGQGEKWLLSTFVRDIQMKFSILNVAKDDSLLKDLTEMVEKDPNRLRKYDGYFGYTAVLWAAKHSAWENVIFLARSGYDVNARDVFYKRSPLYLAAIAKKLSVVEALLVAGADPKLPDIFGVTVVDYLDDVVKKSKEAGNLDWLSKEIRKRIVSTMIPGPK